MRVAPGDRVLIQWSKDNQEPGRMLSLRPGNMAQVLVGGGKTAGIMNVVRDLLVLDGASVTMPE